MNKVIINPFRKVYDSNICRDSNRYDLPAFPLIIDIEVTNACNMDCLVCTRQVMTRKTGFMDWNLYKKIIDEVSIHNAAIRLIRFGEPLLHPKITEMIKYAKKKNLLVHMTTNGLLLSESKSAEIVDFGLDSIIFSMQGTTKEEYQRLRNTKHYDKLVKNIQKLAELRKKKGVSNPYITITTTILDETQEDIDIFIRKWRKTVDCIDYGPTYLGKLKLRSVDRIKYLIPRENTPKRRIKECNEVRTKLSINWNGDVTACCADFDGEMVIGNVLNESLKDVWNGKKHMEICDILKKKEYDKIKFCSTCESRI